MQGSWAVYVAGNTWLAASTINNNTFSLIAGVLLLLSAVWMAYKGK